jgi:hypothetical protein
MKFILIVGLMGCLSFSACSKSSDQQQPGQAGTDVTATVLPSIVGEYTSPTSKIKIQKDGTFAMESTGEHDRWYINSGNPDQHMAVCDIVRRGTLRVIKKSDGQYIELDITQRSVTQGREPQNPSDDPKAVCEKAASIFSSVPSLTFQFLGQDNGAFLMGSPNQQQMYWNELEETALTSAASLVADASMENQLAYLFVPTGKTVDVTDLVGPLMDGTLDSIDNKGKPTPSGVTIDSEFKSLRVVDSGCGVDTKLDFAIRTSGTKVTLLNSSNQVVGYPARPDEPACELEKEQLTLASEPLFDVTDLSDIQGIDHLNGLAIELSVRGVFHQ